MGVDTGGTFTDFVALVGGRVVAFKQPSTPVAPERAVLEGLRRLGANRGTRVRHGSTVATNALLERKGARVTFVTNAGFEDLLEIGRQDRPDIYALAPRRVPPLVPAARRIGVPERLGPRGERWRTATARELGRVAARVRATRPEAVAVGLLHAYAAPRREAAIARALRLGAIPVTASATLCPEVREFERFATAVTNAYLMPRMRRYLEGLARGTPARVEVVLSHGGSAPPAAAAREPVRQLLSGPAAGLVAAREVAAVCGFERALTLDVGGTSTDVAFVERHVPRRRAREVAGFPVLLPVLDVHTVGAGGGSIARVDAGRMLHVGPESAGAMPGPACYGRGGPATVTDALVVLGHIPGAALAGGAFPIHRDAARAALEDLARELGARDAATAAAGVLAVANARIEAALRQVSIEAGHDPRDAALVAFGGAGGLHACAVAEALGVARVIVPRHAGVLSALGALAGAPRRERSRTVHLDAADHARLERAWGELAREARARFPRGERNGLRVERWAEMRYAGQSHELSVRGGPGLTARFHRAHERRFGFASPERRVEVVTLEARVSGRDAWARVGAALRRSAASGSRSGAPGRAQVRHQGRRLVARTWTREALSARAVLRGPAIVTESGATVWIPPGWTARLHPQGALMLARRGRR